MDVEPADYGEPTQADKDTLNFSLDDIKADLAEDWAKKCVAETKEHCSKFWSFGENELLDDVKKDE